MTSLAGRPGHGAAAENMAVEMRDRLARIGAVVNHQSKTALGKAEFGGDFGGFQQQVTENPRIVGVGSEDAGDRFSGDDQDVDGGFGVGVMEGHDLVVFIDDLRRDITINNFLEKRLAHRARE